MTKQELKAFIEAADQHLIDFLTHEYQGGEAVKALLDDHDRLLDIVESMMNLMTN